MNKIILLLAVLLSVGATAQTKLYPVELKQKWGYTNLEGKMVIPAIYDYAAPFSESRAIVALNNQPCVIDEQNKRIVDTGIYMSIARYSEGLSYAMDYKQNKFYIDVQGKRVITLAADIYDARPFRSGLACVAKKVDVHVQKFNHDLVYLGYKFGYMDKSGNMVIPFSYDDADDFENGLARVKVDTKFGVINTSGAFVLQPGYSNIGRFLEGKAVIDKNGTFGYANTEGKIIIEPKFEQAFDFSEGLAGVIVDGKYGYINEKGELVIQPQFDNARAFSEGFAAVKLNNKFGFINPKGELVMRYVFDNATLFSEGRCAVMIKRKWGFIDKTGRMVVPADFESVGTYTDGVAEVVYNGVSAYLNILGRVLPQLGN